MNTTLTQLVEKYLMSGVMVDVVRKDIFKGASDGGHPVGYVLLRKCAPDERNDYLEQVRVFSGVDDMRGWDDYCSWRIVDKQVFDAIEDGDVGFYTRNGALRVLLSRKANHNTLLVTERCDNLCLFCSQPPKKEEDDWLLVQSALAIAAFQAPMLIGISGGEPLLYGQRFVKFIDSVSELSPATSLHVLTNGRAFSDKDYASEVAKRCADGKICFGIPLYSLNSDIHDHLVGSEGAFHETVKGLINAGNLGVPVELRIIPTKKNFSELSSVVEFACRVFSSVSQISIMNLEPTGWAKLNWGTLYVSPESYSSELRKCIVNGDKGGVPIVLYNYPLCHLDEGLRGRAVKSISDWKNYYPEECGDCSLKKQCGGFFSSSKGRTHHKPRKIL
ncbi:His-Xaa-Ser system radical SAM maturase HxsC [Alcanivorax sediminis]|nr:His-Xaa-Ser system radical SAM maturase HxsC [Alcanivorax sediminis]